MKRVLRWKLLLLLCIAGFHGAEFASATNTDPNSTWPLCGRISENPPAGWEASDGCPALRFGNAAFTDEPLSSTFGPRPLFSENMRYDFHRGLDIATPIGTPFFAISDGTVMIAGNHPSYSDPLVSLRHFRPGDDSCNPNGCYTSLYLHINSWVVSASDQVVKGQLLGYSGASSSGFEHLHFEVRDAPAFDAFSAWSRDAIHPLSVLPYEEPNNTTIVFDEVDFTDPASGLVDIGLTSNRYDLVGVDLNLFDDSGQALPQSGDTPDARGYYVEPSFFNMNTWNFMFSHKDSSAFEWESFGAGGVSECPYHADHGASYNANIHMDQQHPDNPLEGQFTELPAPDATANLGDAGHRWLTAVGPISGNQAVMNIEMTSGGLFDTSTEIIRTDPPGSDGSITLTFDSCNSGTIEYNIPSIDRQGIVPIQRVASDNIALCEALQSE